MTYAKTLFGATKPRIETPNPAGRSRGKDVALFAEKLGMPLLPWQKHLFDHALKLDKHNKWRHVEVASIVARQQGKSHAARMRILAGLFLFGEQSIVMTAQDRQLARETFRLVVETIEGNPMLDQYKALVRWANGQEELVMKTGQRLRIVAPTPSAARGYANDLILIDELREQTDFDLWAAIRPTINTRRNATVHGPQVWLASNAGHAESVLLLQKRQQALDIVNTKKPGSLAFLEWSAPENANIDDIKNAWVPANPALGHLFGIETIQANRALPEAVFRTEQLCQFVETMQAWLPAGNWEACEDTLEIPADVKPGQVIFGVDRSPSWDSVSIVAVADVDERTVCEVVEHFDAGISEDALLDRLGQLIAKWQPDSIAADEFLLGDFLNKLSELTGARVHKIRGVDVQRACNSLYQYVTSGKLAHLGDPLLTTHVNAAARKEYGEGWRLSRRHSSRHIDAVMALAAAVYAHDSHGPTPLIMPTQRK